MKKFFVYMASAAFMLVACNQAEIEAPVGGVSTPVETEAITVDLNPMTKTFLNGMETVWSEGDVVSVTVDGTVIGTLELEEGNTFTGEVEAGHTGEAILNYPAGVTAVPTEQKAVEGTFANGVALLEGTTTMDKLRNGEGASLQNKTALLSFSSAESGDVVFTIGANTYTVTGCEAEKSYYACVTPVEDVALSYTIAGKGGAKSKPTVTFAAGLIYDLGTLEVAIEMTTVYLKPSSGWQINNATFAAWIWATDEDGTWYDMSDDNSDGVYEVTFPKSLDNIIFASMNGANDWENKVAQTDDLKVPTDNKNAYIVYSSTWDTFDNAKAYKEPEKVCKLTVRVNKAITWYDKYIYSWTTGVSTGSWPGTKMSFDKEEGNYYVYYYNFPYALNGKRIDYVINGGNGSGQTKDMNVTLNGENTIVTIEKTNIK